MKMNNSLISLCICITLFFGVYSSILLFTCIPLTYEFDHLTTISNIRESNYDESVIQSLQTNNIVINEVVPYVYEVKSSNIIEISIIDYEKIKESISYLYAGDM